jgi:hypothetical protein
MKQPSRINAMTFLGTLLAISNMLAFVTPARANEAAKDAAADVASKTKTPKGWMYCAEHESDYETFIDTSEKHSGKSCATLRSIVKKPRPFGNLMQYIDAKNYVGKRVKLSAGVKSKIESGTCQLWIRIDGEWESDTKTGAFDNMDDRPINGITDWKKYDLVVQLPAKSTGIAFGMMLIGKGQVWVDDVSLEEVGKDVPLTGKYAHGTGYSATPMNLNFEE